MNSIHKVNKLHAEIQLYTGNKLKFMEVCGTHTMAAGKSGLKDLLPSNIELVSGPGCPVCVTEIVDIDRFLYLAVRPEIIFATFGDMFLVPGSRGSMQTMKSNGTDVRIVYSPLAALEIAVKNPQAEVVFISVGFETTAPTAAVAVETAKREGIENFSLYSLHKLVPPALRALIENPGFSIDGFILPGHVCSITGTAPFAFLTEEFNIPCVVSGFEPIDILEAIARLITQNTQSSSELENPYWQVAASNGNPKALEYINKYFDNKDASWRGLGIIPASGLRLRQEHQCFDTEAKFEIPYEVETFETDCRCGDVLCGRINPDQCKLFASTCTPKNPLGPCMISSEGTCGVYYHYPRQRMVRND